MEKANSRAVTVKRLSSLNQQFDRTFISLRNYMENVKPIDKTTHITRKLGRDIVTDADFRIETDIINIIKKDFPSHNIMTEESKYASTDSPYLWVIDPIDGTINFSKNYPLYAISVGLMRKNKILRGIVSVPPLRKFYSAIDNQGSFCNDQRIHVSDSKQLDESLVSIMLTTHYDSDETNVAVKAISTANMRVRGVRIVVCEAAELCLIAEGILDANLVCVKADRYGAIAGQLILQEAGGKLTELSGKPFGGNSDTILATNKLLHSELVRLYASSEDATQKTG